MNTCRTGKIAHLPLALRTELNHRMDNGVPGRELITWLNAEPEVQRILAKHFQGHPVIQQNLSQWRCGGYQDWVKLQETRYLTLELVKAPEESVPEIDTRKVTHALTTMTTVELMVAHKTRYRDCTDTEERWKHVCDLTTRLWNLRRDQMRADTLALDQEIHAYKAAAEQRATQQAIETEARRQVLAS